MSDLPPRPPRRSVTEGRPLPARDTSSAGTAAAATATPSATPSLFAAPTAPAASVASVAAPVAATPTPHVVATAARPDPRPMRLVYGAGAVAALSVMTVGLVQPTFNGTAAESAGEAADPVTEVAASFAAPGRNGPTVQVRHVIRYVQLRPGERAPRGARVIGAERSNSRVTRNGGDRRPEAQRPGTNRPRQRQRAQPGPVSNANPRPQPEPQPQPQAQPKPPVNTHQSGG
jgi:hypothetical protein